MNKTNSRTSALLAALPHINVKHQREMAIIIKFMEMRDVLEYYDTVQASNAEQGASSWKQNLLAAMLPHMSEKNQKTMSSFLQMMEMQEMMTKMQQMQED